MRKLRVLSKYILALIFTALIGAKGWGQTNIWTNPLTGTNLSSSNPYSRGQTVNSNISVSGIGRVGVAAVNSTNSYNTDAWGTGGSINTNKYLTFTLTPSAGYKIKLASFIYTGTREAGNGSNIGPTSFAFRSDANSNNFSTNIGTPISTGATIDLSGSDYQNLGSATVFRFYAWNAGVNGEYSIDDFTFNGSVLGTSVTTLTGFSTCANIASTAQSFAINGAGLSPANATITIAPSTNYEVSVTSAISGFQGSGSVNLTASGGSVSETVWVRLKSNGIAGNYNGENINVSGGGFTVANGISVSVSGTVNTTPAVPTGTAAQSFCSGASPTVANLTATGTAIQWYATSSGGAALATSTALVNGAHYYASQTVSGCESSARFDVTVTMNANPLAPSTGGNQTICSGQTIPSLTVTVGVGQTADWYTAFSGGTLLLAGNTSYTPTGTGTYYAEARNTTTGCVSASRTAVALTINATPAITSISPGSRCGTGTVVLSAATSSGTLNWYDAPSGGNYLGTGSSFTTPSISTTTTYYVDATAGGCTSDRTAVVASVISPAITAGGGGSFCAGTNVSLTSNGTTITNQYWTGPNSFYSLDQNPVISNVTTAMSGTYIVTGSSLSAANLVTNGNFSSGNTGFTTEYVLAAQTSSGLNPEGAYDVVALPSSRHSNFCSCGDHTSGSGLQMVINGAGTESVIWSQTVNVVSNTAYQFTYWVQTVVNGNDPNPSKIQLFVNGSNAGIVYTANATTGVWTQFTYNWTSGSGITTAILDLKNENFAPGGNDFALDDIEFYQVCEATSSVNVTVDPTSVGGAVNGGTTVCSGSASGLLTLSGHTGTITKWQYSVDNWVTPVDIANTSTTYTSGALTQTTQFRAVVTSGVCSSANSAATTVTVEPAIANSTISANQTFCTSGDPAQLNGSVPTGGSGTFSYQWQSSPDNTTWTNIGSATAQNYDPSAIASTTYYRRGVSSGSCPMVYSASVQILIEPNLPASVSVVASSTTICAGTSVTFTATPTNGGTGPTYQWKLNGSNVGSGGTTYTNVSLANGDVVTCIMTSNATPCLTGSPATSNAVSMTVNPNLPASVSIGATATTICDGTSVTFTATPTNGGAAPTYQWKLNGVNVGSGGTTYTNASLANGDVVTCIMTSNATPCLTGSPATSNAVTMTVNPNLTPTVTIASSPAGAICAGTSVTFTATAGNAGGGTVSYNFKVDGTSQQNGASNTFASTTLTNGNAVTCEITVTGGTCLITNTATSNTITMIVNSLTGTPTFTSGATSICQDANDETYTATAANSISIAYSVLPVEAGLINASTGVMNWSASFFGTATITATANGLCGTTSADQIVTINPLPTPGPIIPD